MGTRQPLTTVGLDPTRQALASPEVEERVPGWPSTRSWAEFFLGLMAFFRKACPEH